MKNVLKLEMFSNCKKGRQHSVWKSQEISRFCCKSSTQCWKITEKVAFNIASEASYVYILSGQKFIKNAKDGQFWRVFENFKFAVKQCYQTGHF